MRLEALMKSLFSSRKGRFGILLFLAVYSGVYALLSSKGHYMDNLSSLEKIGCLKNLAVRMSYDADRQEWQPKSVIVTRFPKNTGDPFLIHIHANASGWFFMPLVCVDRLFVHKTKSITPTE
jgi:hypothetical protein